MKLTITRNKSTIDGTTGSLVTDAGFSCDTLELPWENNLDDMSCINADIYDGLLWYSPTLMHTVIRLGDKHGRTNILLHNGNFAGEGVGEIKQVLGCTAVGKGYAQIIKPSGGTQFGITTSVVTLMQLVAHIVHAINNKPFTVEYKWDDGCAPSDLRDLNPKSDLYVKT